MKLILICAFFWPHSLHLRDWKFWSTVGAMGAAFAADYATTTRCQPGCIERNRQFGPHPSAGRVAAIGGAYFAGEVALAGYMRQSKRPWLRRAWWILPAVEIGSHARLARQNAGLE